MVKKFLISLISFLSIAYGAEFNARVNKTQLALNDKISLTLSLSDARASSEPDFSQIRNEFDIRSTSQFSNIQIVNGKSSTSFEWRLILQPKKIGRLLIDGISINTNKGTLSTNKIKINVTEPEYIKSEDIDLIVTTQNKSPYKYESFILTIKLKTKRPIGNITLSDIEIPNAGVKLLESHKIYDEYKKGNNVKIIERKYMITPISGEKIIIPRVKATGVFLSNRNRIFSFYDDEEFTLYSDELTIDIQKPIENVTPWIPAISISLSEDIDSGDFFVGQPISRRIIINGEGLLSNQLPHLNQKSASGIYKIYQDPPKISDDITDDNIRSTRIESFIIAPNKTGKITLPKISIQWWDVENKKLVTSYLPERVLDILPQTDINDNEIHKLDDHNHPKQEESVKDNKSNNWLIYLAIILLLLTLLISTIIYLTRRGSKSKSPKNTRNNIPSIESLRKATSAEELVKFIRNYATTKYGITENLPLENILVSMNCNIDDRVKEFIDSLESSLYHNESIDIAIAKCECENILKSSLKKSKTQIIQNKLESLNYE